MADNITPQDQFEEIIEFIRTTDKVLGDPPGTTGVLTGPINKVIQKIANSLLNLKTRIDGLNITVPNASTTVKGIAELATKLEAETGTDTTRIIVAKRVYDILKHANAQATTLQRGTGQLATRLELLAGTTTKIVTPDSLYRRNATTSGLTITTDNANNVVISNTDWDKTVKYFGPILFADEINISFRYTQQNLGQEYTYINLTFDSSIDVDDYNWTFDVTRVQGSGSIINSGSVSSSYNRLQFRMRRDYSNTQILDFEAVGHKKIAFAITEEETF